MAEVYDVMVDHEFEQMVAEACHVLGKETVLRRLIAFCDKRHPLEMNRGEREAFLMPLAARMSIIAGGFEGGGRS